MKILKSSGLITWPCSVPTRMSIFGNTNKTSCLIKLNKGHIESNKLS